MEIIWFGHSCFRLRGRDVVVITDPFAPSTGYSLGRVTADIVTISHDHPGHSNAAAIGGSPRVLQGPGEYEIGDALITGVRTYHDKQKGSSLGKNTVFVIDIENVRVGHMGDLGHQPTAEQLEEIGDVDVLLIPVGGHSTMDAAQAAHLVSAIAPRLVIPMHYKTPAVSAKLDPVDRFLKEMGVTPEEPVARVSVQRSNLPQETQVVLMEYRRQ